MGNVPDRSGVVVVQFRRSDWMALRSIRLTALQDAPTSFMVNYVDHVDWTEDDWCAVIDRDAVFVARRGGSDAGMVCGVVERDGQAGLTSMWVRPAYRGSGVGDALVDAVVGWACKRGSRQVRLWVMGGHRHPENLYQRHGFALTGRQGICNGQPEVQMMLSLNA